MADVIFENDRGFWSGLSNLLELARRPIVLTCSDPHLCENIPISARICSIRPPPREAVVPYLRLISLTEGFKLDAEPALGICSANYECLVEDSGLFQDRPPAGVDVRRSVNQLQLLVAHASTTVPGSTSLIQPAVVDLDVLLLLDRICPTLRSISLDSAPKQQSAGTTPGEMYAVDRLQQNKTPISDLAVVFDDNGEMQAKGTLGPTDFELLASKNETSPEFPKPTLSHCTRFLPITDSLLVSLKHMTAHCSWLDACSAAFVRSNLCHSFDHSSDPTPTPNPIRSDTVVTVNPVMTDTCAPRHAFDDSQSTFWLTWSDALAKLEHGQLMGHEVEANQQLDGSPIGNDHLNYRMDSFTNDGSAYHRLFARLWSDLTKTGHNGGRNVGHQMVCNRRALACDYMPCLRAIAAGESFRQSTSAKRRFFHYFDRINLYLSQRTRSLLSKLSFRLPE